MNLRKSWISAPLLKNIIKNNLFPAKVSLSVFLGVFVLAILSGASSNIGMLCVFVFAISAVVLTTIYPCYLQSYLVDKTKASIVSALPLKTGCIWFTNYLAGYLIALITLMIEGVCLLIIMDFTRYGDGLDMSFRFLVAIVMLLFVYYTIAYTVCCMSGNRLGQVLFSIAIYVLPLVFIVAMMFIGPKVVPGLDTGIGDDLAFLIFPLGAGVNFIYNGTMYLVFHCVLAGILFVFSYYIYKNRVNEYIGAPLVFKKIVIVLKAVMVLACATAGFSVILYVVDLDINYGLQGIMAMLIIYLLVGLVASIMIEIILKSKHIYRNLLVYLPMLVIIFGINYYLADQRYLDTVVNFSGRLESTVSIEYQNALEFSYHSLKLDDEVTKAFHRYLSEHREMLYYTRDDNDPDTAMFITYHSIYEDDNNINDSSYYGVDYCYNKQALIDFFNGSGKQYFEQLFKNIDSLNNEKYLIYYGEGKTAYITSDEIAEFIKLIDNNSITPEQIYTTKIAAFIGSNDKSYPIVINDMIEEFLNREELLQREAFVDQCQSLYREISEGINNEYDHLIQAALETMFNYETIDKFYYEDTNSTFEFTNDYVIYGIDYQVVTKEGNVYSYPVDFKFVRNDDTVTVASVSIGGNEND